MAWGCGTRVFKMVGVTTAIRDNAKVVRWQGASGGFIAAAMTAVGYRQDELRTLASSTNLGDYYDVPPELLKGRLRKLRSIGCAKGEFMERQLDELFGAMGHRTWGTLRYRPWERPEGTDWTHKLSAAICTFKVRQKDATSKLDLEAARTAAREKHLLKHLAEKLRNFERPGLELVTFPEDVSTRFPWLAEHIDTMPLAQVARWTAGHPFVFGPDFLQTPTTETCM